MKQIEITTSCGRLRGRKEEEHLEYRGIRYATAGRFEYPNLVTSWEGTYDATEYGPCSYQRRSFEDDAECNRFYHKEFRAVICLVMAILLGVLYPLNKKRLEEMHKEM